MSLEIEKTIVLVGLMGAGKTSIGRRLAKELNIEFRDSDQEIEKKVGCSVAEIFEGFGESYFRQVERETIKDLLRNSPPHVLATGGGAFMDAETRELIKEEGLSVWLRAALDVLADRVSRNDNRPLLNRGNPREILEKLIELRYPIYAEADLVVDSDSGPHFKVVEQIIWKL
jgi:shikimate kinase